MNSSDFPPLTPLADVVEPHQDVDAVFAPSVASSQDLFGSASGIDQQTSSEGSSAPHGRVYCPLVETLRLYAGWLLAWYGAIFALGSYQSTHVLPFKSEIINDMISSPFIVVAAFATFLFLLLTHVHRLCGRGTVRGLILSLVWIALVFLFQRNV